MRGLLGRPRLAVGHGLLLRPARAVHTWFMRFAIDIVFLDRQLTVLATAERVPPWRAERCKGARAVLELPAGACAARGLAPGEQLGIRESPPAEVLSAAC
jgi:uncharacterized membrane protein (UPF0127 family)